MTRDEFKRRLRHLGVWELFAFKMETRALPGILEEDETILAATSGVWEARRWVVLATDKRWLFVRSQVVAGGEMFQKAPVEITGCVGKTGWLFGRFTLQTVSGEMTFRNVPKRTVAQVIATATPPGED